MPRRDGGRQTAGPQPDAAAWLRSPLEGCADGQPEGLARLAQLEERPVQLLRLCVAEIARAACREHVAGDEVLVADLLQQPQWVVGVVNAEGRPDDGQQHGNLPAGGHTWHRVRAFKRPDLVAEMDLLTALARAIEVYGAAVERGVQLIDGEGALNQLRLARSHGHAEVVEELEGDRAAQRNAVLDVAGEL